MQTLILCGGRGTRAYPHTVELPKPLLEVAGRPILRHVLEIYASQGCTEFILAAGFQWRRVAEFAASLPTAWDVEVVDTGEATNTGGRVERCRDRLDETFFVTYGDGLGDVDLGRLLAFHRSHDGCATLTTVPLPSQYGTISCAGDGRVERFQEKPLLLDHWINAGFFVFDHRAFDQWGGDDLERQVLPGLGAAGELFAYRHQGFWKSMDTYKDCLDLTALCETAESQEGRPPWLRFATPVSSSPAPRGSSART